MEGMTELVNGTFIEDLSTLLSSCTDGKTRKTFFEIDKEFVSMTAVMKSNFVTVTLSFCLCGLLFVRFSYANLRMSNPLIKPHG